MTITLTWGHLPLAMVLAATVAMACAMSRPYRRQGDYDFGAVSRVLWLIPILLMWAGYFGGLLLYRAFWGKP